MRNLWLRWHRVVPIAVSLLSAAVVLGTPAPALATPSSNVRLFLTQHDDFGPVAWQAHGALEGAGTWDRGVVTFSGGHSPVFAGMIQTFETNGSDTGSFQMDFQGLGYNATGAFSGTWVISHGRGSYERLHGTGTWFEIDIPDPNNPGHLLFTFPCTGTVHFD